jgi:hypothetical protein
MRSDLLQVLVDSANEAADDVLLEALRLGTEEEKADVLSALLRRQNTHGLAGVVEQFPNLSETLQRAVLRNIKLFPAALRQCAMGKDETLAITAMRLVAIGRQGRMSYILSEGLHGQMESVSKAAVEAMVALARWVATETRRLQRTDLPLAMIVGDQEQNSLRVERATAYRHLMEQRPEIEQAVVRAIDVHRGKYGPELLRAALLLVDWPGSKALAILHTPKHGGQTAMVRRLQQAPDAEHVEAFLLAATHAGLRMHFGIVFSHISEPPALDAVLRKTHWLKDQQLQSCVHQVDRGVWWDSATLKRDVARRDDEDAARIGEWLSASAIDDVVQDQLLDELRIHLGRHYAGRLRLLRIALRRPLGSSVSLLISFLNDSDQRLVRLAARELVRRKPLDYENILIRQMERAPDAVRRVIGRAVGHAAFESYWERFDRMDQAARASAGHNMVRVLPDVMQRLERRMRGGPLEQRIKAIHMAQELNLAEALMAPLLAACRDPNPKLRSKAVALLAAVRSPPPQMLLETVINDADPRVRANAIEVLESQQRLEFVPLLTERARSAHSRERANAIKALHRMKVSTASSQLVSMLKDERPDHRISALWAMKQIGWWKLLNEVGQIAKADPSDRVRRYALAVLRNVAELFKSDRAAG